MDRETTEIYKLLSKTLKKYTLLTGYPSAVFERISFVSGRTRANRVVIDSLANGIDATRPDARVLALLTDASLAGRTLAADETLGAAVRRFAEEASLAATHWTGASHLADRVGAARVRIARVGRTR